MNLVARIIAILFGIMATFYLVAMIAMLGGGPNDAGPPWLGGLVVISALTIIGALVWKLSGPTGRPGLLSSVFVGAFVVGGIGFVGGFFGPILFTPESNQGPLLGLFGTGPLGFILGAVGGAIVWAVRGRRAAGDEAEGAATRG